MVMITIVDDNLVLIMIGSTIYCRYNDGFSLLAVMTNVLIICNITIMITYCINVIIIIMIKLLLLWLLLSLSAT